MQNKFEDVLNKINDLGIISKCQELINFHIAHAKKQLEIFDNSQAKLMLCDIASSVASRKN